MASDKTYDQVFELELKRVQVENFAVMVQFWQDALARPGGLATDWSKPLMQLLDFAVQHGFWGAGFLDAAHFLECRQLQAAFEAYAPGVGYDLLTRLPRDEQGRITKPFGHE